MRALFLLIAVLQLAAGIVPAGWVICAERDGAIALEAAGDRCCEGAGEEGDDTCRDVPTLGAATAPAADHPGASFDLAPLPGLHGAAVVEHDSAPRAGCLDGAARCRVTTGPPRLVLRL